MELSQNSCCTHSYRVMLHQNGSHQISVMKQTKHLTTPSIVYLYGRPCMYSHPKRLASIVNMSYRSHLHSCRKKPMGNRIHAIFLCHNCLQPQEIKNQRWQFYKHVVLQNIFVNRSSMEYNLCKRKASLLYSTAEKEKY